jgi:ADP-heptose:LPS heptosyltransferase
MVDSSISALRSRSMKILVRRVCGLGDLLLTLPYLQALRRMQGPNSEVHLLAHREHVELLKALGFLTQGFTEEGSGWHHFYSMKAVPWQAVHPDPRDYEQLHLFVAQAVCSTLSASLQTRVPGGVTAIPAFPPRRQRVHASVFYLSHLQGPRSVSLPRAPRVFPPENSCDRVHELLQKLEPGRVPVLVHAGSGSPKKNWPVARYARLLSWLAEHPRLQPMLLQGPNDEARIDEIWRRFPPARPFVLARGLGLIELASLLRQCSMMIGNDSGVTHLAALLGVSTVAIFGPSNPEQWAPMGKRVHVLYRPTECAPCHPETDRPCRHDECERFSEVYEVQDAVHRLHLAH